MYSHADLIVTVTQSFKDKLVDRGVNPGKIIVISNGALVNIYHPGEKDRELIKSLDISGKFVVSYIGAHGISQGVDTIVEAAEMLRFKSDICFLLVGDGAMKNDISDLILDKDLSNIIMLPSQSKDIIPDLYRVSNVCVVPLRDIPLFDSFVPSKIFEIMACGIPIIASLTGEAKTILQTSGSAKIVHPESVNELVDAIEWMIDNQTLCTTMGESGRKFVCEHYDRAILAKTYISELRRLLD